MFDDYPLTQDDKTYGMLVHLIALAGFIIPLGNLIGPLIIWMIKKDQSEWVDKQGRESLNFQISITIYAVASGVLAFIAVGLILLAFVGIFSFIMIIIATVRAHSEEDFQYPLSIRVL